jgi:predicted metal-dependent phosphotriesterase family hydrolase
MRESEYDYGLEPGERFEPDEELDEPFDQTLPHVMTALGPVDPDALGFTLPQEHVISRPPGSDPDLQLDDVAKAVGELEGYALSGGRALVDLTTADYGRDVGDILWVAQRVPVHVVLATGYHRPWTAASDFGDASLDMIADRMVRELTDGIDGTDVRAGVIVAGSGSIDPSPAETHGLRAAAKVHGSTGAPVSILSRHGNVALRQFATLMEEGVDPARVTAGGFDVLQDESVAQRLLDTGAFVCVRGWGRSSDDELAEMVKRLVDAGYGEQLLISGGFARRSQWLAFGGGPGFVHFIDQIPLTMMEAGLNALTVRKIFVENPARALTTVRPKSN